MALLADEAACTVEIDLASSLTLAPFLLDSSSPLPVVAFRMLSFACRALWGSELILDNDMLNGIIEIASQAKRQPTTNMSGVAFVEDQAFGMNWVEYSYTFASTAQNFKDQYPWCQVLKFSAPTICRGFRLPIRFVDPTCVMRDELAKFNITVTGLTYTS